MFIIANFLVAVASVLDWVLWAFMWIIVARAILSWVDADPYNPVVRFLHSTTEPVLHRVRRVFPLQTGGIDLSPILVFIAIIFLQRFLIQSLYDLSRTLR